MKQKLIFLVSCFLFMGINLKGYGQFPPPCGILGYYACDEDADSLVLFDLTVDNDVYPFCYTNANPSDYYPVSYHLTDADAQAGTNPIANPENYVMDFSSNPEYIYIYARTEPISNTLPVLTGVNGDYRLVEKPILPTISPLIENDPEGDGYAEFDLTLKDAEILSYSPYSEDKTLIEYFVTESDAIDGINPLSQLYENVVPLTQTIYVRLSYNNSQVDCFDVAPFDLIAQNTLSLEGYGVEDEILIFPNPAKNEVNVSFTNISNKLVRVNILDLQGKMVINREKSIIDSKVNLDVSSLSTGIYFMELTVNHVKQVQKLIID